LLLAEPDVTEQRSTSGHVNRRVICFWRVFTAIRDPGNM
jgi:hypothetical protein